MHLKVEFYSSISASNDIFFLLDMSLCGQFKELSAFLVKANFFLRG